MKPHEIKDGWLVVDGRTITQLTESGIEHVEEVVKLYLDTLDVEYQGEYPYGGYVTWWAHEEADARGWVE